MTWVEVPHRLGGFTGSVTNPLNITDDDDSTYATVHGWQHGVGITVDGVNMAAFDGATDLRITALYGVDEPAPPDGKFQVNMLYRVASGGANSTFEPAFFTPDTSSSLASFEWVLSVDGTGDGIDVLPLLSGYVRLDVGFVAYRGTGDDAPHMRLYELRLWVSTDEVIPVDLPRLRKHPIGPLRRVPVEKWQGNLRRAGGYR